MPLFDMINDIVESLFITLLCVSMMVIKKDKRYLCFVLWVVLSVVTILFDKEDFNYFVLNVLSIGLVFGMLYLTSSQGVFYCASISVLALLFLDMTNIIALLLVSLTTHMEISDLTTVEQPFRMAIILSKILYAVMIIMMYGIKKKYQEAIQRKSSLWMPFFLCVIVINYCSNVIFPMVYVQSMDKRLILSLVIGLFLLIVWMLIFFFMVQQKNLDILKNQLQLRTYEHQYQSFIKDKDTYAKLKEIRHNQKHLLGYLSYLLEDNQIEKAKEELSNQKEILSHMKSAKLCENPLLNMLFEEKRILAGQHGIKMEVDINLPEKLAIEELELYILIENIMTNAIEHCEAPFHIHVKGYTRDYHAYLVIENTIQHDVLIQNPLLKTTKKDRDLHGYGITSCQRIVDNCSGVLSFSQKKNFFVCTIVIPF